MIIRSEYEISEVRNLVNSIRYRNKADLIIKNVNIVDVITGSIDKGSILIRDKYIMLLSEREEDYSAFNTFDAKDLYAIPGFIDSHTHVESSMTIPSLYSLYQLKEGVTTAIVDPHEIVNVAGLEGLKAFIDDLERSPMKFIVQIPPCIPASDENLETSGALLSSAGIEEAIRDLADRVSGLAEVMCYEKILWNDEDLFKKIMLIYERGFIIDGHASGLKGYDLQAYVASRIMTDHTVRKTNELLERLKLGVYIQIQNRPQESDFSGIVKQLRSLESSRVMWCTDDAEADELASGKYSVRAIVRDAIENGLDPVKAIKMATINVAQAYRVDTKLGIISPGRYADIVLVHSLDNLNIHTVITNGKIVFHHGKLLLEIPEPSPQLLKFKGNTIKLKREIRAEDLLPVAPVEKGLARVRVLNIDGGLEMRETKIDNYIVMCDPGRDIAWMNVIERHGKTGNISRGFVAGTGVKVGAFVSSISHDSHNILIVSVDVKSSLVCLKEIMKTGGGLCLARNGDIISLLPLPFYGLMSSDPDLPEKLRIFKEELNNLGFKVPLKRLLTLTLPVRKTGFAITDKGLVDYRRKEILPIIVSINEK